MIVSYNWLKEYLGETAPSPEEVADLLTFRAFEIDGVEEAGKDTVIDVDVLPNRSSDCLCHRGIAREIATLLDAPLAYDPLREAPALPMTDLITVDIENAEECPRFSASLITDIKIKESPRWLKDRLEALGQRSINNVVDATNYVMYAIGQPLHAYDADLFPQTSGVWQFEVRKAKAGETVSLLAEGGKEEDRVIECTGSELLIVDKSSGTPIGLAGVKGGRYAGVHEGTTKIIVEAAHFDPTLTRKTARGLGIVIDASKRFENEPSRELPIYAQGEIVKLISDIAHGKCEGVMDKCVEKKLNPQVAVRTEKVNELLGLALKTTEMIDIVTRIGAAVEETADGFAATGPFERTDLNLEEDYIDEIGRIYGLSHIESVEPGKQPLGEISAQQYYSEQVRQTLLDLGFSEVITSSFCKKDEIQLFNAMASDKSYMRSSLVPNLDECLSQNLPHKDLLGLKYIAVFEIGTVFTKDDESLSENISLAFGVRHKGVGETKEDVKKLMEAVTALETLLASEIPVSSKNGVIEINLEAAIAKLPAPIAYEPAPPRRVIAYRPHSQYPAIARDIALWVDEAVTAKEVGELLDAAAGDLRARTTLFDTFSKDGRTSYAFRIIFQSSERTLTDSEVNKIMDKVYDAAEKAGFEVR